MLTQTQEKIQSAFIDLLFEKDFDKISVSDISKQAQINRGTFYLHYLDKYDLLDTIETSIISELAILSSASQNIDQIDDLINPILITKTLEYIKDNLHTIQALIHINRKQSNDIIKVVFRNFLHTKLETLCNFTVTHPYIEQPYVEAIIISLVSSIIYVWLEKDTVESCEDITKMILTAFYYAPMQLVQYK